MRNVTFRSLMTLTLPLLLAVGSIAPAAAADREGAARAVAEEYFKAIAAKDFGRAADQISNDDLREFGAIFRDLFRMEAGRGTSELLALTFGQEATLEAAQGAPSREIFSRVLTMVMNSRGTGNISIDEFRFIGLLDEPETGLSHVIARSFATVDGISANQIEVVSVREVDGKWVVVMPEQMRAMGAMFRARLGG